MFRAAALAAVAACSAPAASIEEPDEPRFPRPERIEELVLAGDGFVLPGTLELPATSAPIPCAVFFAGSGPTDRDWRSRLGSGPATGRLLAGALRARGIGSLRFDKVGSARNRRGLGRLSLDHYRDEGILAFELLDDRPECARIVLLGYGEGAIHALRTAAAKASDPALGGVVTLAAPAEPLIEQLLDQIWAAELRRGADQGELAQLLADFRFAASRGGPRPDFGGVAALARLWRSLDHPVNARVARELLFADPLEAAAAYAGSALIVSAGDADPDAGARVLAALAEPRAAAVRRREVIGGADPMFAGGDRLAPGTVEAIVSFIDAVATREAGDTARDTPR